MKDAYNTLKVSINAAAPLIMHNGQLANPMSQVTKRLKSLTGKRSKTDEDQLDIARVEFEGGLYFDNAAGPFIPPDNLTATIINGARKSKMGKQAELGVFVAPTNGSGVIKLEYNGPRDIEGLWGGGTSEFVFSKMVDVDGKRIMRTRPIFNDWSLKFVVRYDGNMINAESVIKALIDAGTYVGLCEWRPRYGRFSVEVV